MKPFHTVLNRVSQLLRYLSGMITLAGPGISTEGRVSIARHVRLRATDGGFARLADGVDVDRFSNITVKHGRLEIDTRTYIGQFCVVCARESIKIGTDCLIAEHVSIRDQDHRFGPGLTTAEAGFTTSPITIGNNVWIGAKSTITKGVTIGDNSVIGANSVVTHDIPANSIAVGAPARVIRTISNTA